MIILFLYGSDEKLTDILYQCNKSFQSHVHLMTANPLHTNLSIHLNQNNEPVMDHCAYQGVMMIMFGKIKCISVHLNSFYLSKRCIFTTVSCADPDIIVRGGPTLTTFFFSLLRGGRIKIPLLAVHHRSASETPFKWRFAGVPMIALH